MRGVETAAITLARPTYITLSLLTLAHPISSQRIPPRMSLSDGSGAGGACGGRAASSGRCCGLKRQCPARQRSARRDPARQPGTRVPAAMGVWELRGFLQAVRAAGQGQ